MGERVAFKVIDSGTHLSEAPLIYDHWVGGQHKAVLAELAERMEDRKNDAPYAAANLVQLLRNRYVDSNLSVGVYPPDYTIMTNYGLWVFDSTDNTYYKSSTTDYD